ncbi:invasion associated locus B family protein [Halocynthiibacter sp. C4]|uniref:invasion associated locus B family protein n=1 Tax=Halocynthiibacter sp. C4 TaxID=2992758 RepID=UPI00237B8B9E|nr:invasion associated locus B family protein [Halocynthiibacter sp. C4]MDE0591500.1 invasion associated locus B family protein [Halocynthiibacter sp. C4]
MIHKSAWLGVMCAAIVFMTAKAFAVERMFEDWELTCPSDGRICTIATTSFAEDRTWLATLRLQPNGVEGANLPLQILVPPQVHLASGLFVSVNGVGQRQAAYQVCSPRACDARLTLSEDDLLAWKRARSAQIRFRPNPASPPIEFEVSLMGLTAAIDAVDEVAK